MITQYNAEWPLLSSGTNTIYCTELPWLLSRLQTVELFIVMQTSFNLLRTSMLHSKILSEPGLTAIICPHTISCMYELWYHTRDALSVTPCHSSSLHNIRQMKAGGWWLVTSDTEPQSVVPRIIAIMTRIRIITQKTIQINFWKEKKITKVTTLNNEMVLNIHAIQIKIWHLQYIEMEMCAEERIIKELLFNYKYNSFPNFTETYFFDNLTFKHWHNSHCV